MNCSKCGKAIRFYQGKFTYIEIDENGAKKIECHLDCITKAGFDLLDGTHLDLTSNSDRNISDLDESIREELK
ncbi:MAG: hypothetical protein ACW98K_18540 [Candidatus Kariarchaeaceae archaeon]|jgi:hypothetical protein